MGIISKNERKITLYYHSATSLGKRTYAYVTSSKKHLLAIDISKTKVTGSQWAEIADGLGIAVADIINMDHPDFVAKYGKERLELEPHDWLKILEKSPELLVCPIVVMGNRFIQVKTPSEFVRFLGSDSAGLEMD